jgi:2-methylene-furan-3-one reductase
MAVPTTQKAWIYKEFGPKENLHLADVIVPPTGPDAVLVKVQAAALNPIDTMRRVGLFAKIGAPDSELPTVPGYDVAGVVVHVGEEAKKFKVGDRVYGDVIEHAMYHPKQYGALGQFCVVEERLLAPIPESLSYAEAASLPVGLLTAYQSLAEAGELKEGQTVLILGGAGGVGSLAVELAKYVFKASVVAATCSTPKVEFVKSLGADVVIDYKKESLADHPTKYDVVADFVAQGETLLALKENGKAIVYNGSGQPPILNFGVVSRGADLEKLNPYLEDGTIKPVLDPKGQFKFSEVVEAYGYLDSGRAAGKIVVSVE